MSVYGSVGASSHMLASRKRKDRDDDCANSNPPPTLSTPSSSLLGSLRPPPHVTRRPLLSSPSLTGPGLGRQLPSPHPAPAVAKQTPATPPAKPGGNRLLIAGYLAHEFLSRGTLFGRPYGTAPRSEDHHSSKRKQQYEEVARIVWAGGACVPGIINPTQLRAWLQKQQEM